MAKAGEGSNHIVPAIKFNVCKVLATRTLPKVVYYDVYHIAKLPAVPRCASQVYRIKIYPSVTRRRYSIHRS